MWAEFFITLEWRTTTPNPEGIKEKIDKFNYIKPTNFCMLPLSPKQTSSKIKRQMARKGKRFAVHVRDKGLIFLIYKEFLRIKRRKTNSPVEKWQRI